MCFGQTIQLTNWALHRIWFSALAAIKFATVDYLPAAIWPIHHDAGEISGLDSLRLKLVAKCNAGMSQKKAVNVPKRVGIYQKPWNSQQNIFHYTSQTFSILQYTNSYWKRVTCGECCNLKIDLSFSVVLEELILI